MKFRKILTMELEVVFMWNMQTALTHISNYKWFQESYLPLDVSFRTLT